MWAAGKPTCVRWRQPSLWGQSLQQERKGGRPAGGVTHRPAEPAGALSLGGQGAWAGLEGTPGDVSGQDVAPGTGSGNPDGGERGGIFREFQRNFRAMWTFLVQRNGTGSPWAVCGCCTELWVQGQGLPGGGVLGPEVVLRLLQETSDNDGRVRRDRGSNPAGPRAAASPQGGEPALQETPTRVGTPGPV